MEAYCTMHERRLMTMESSVLGKRYASREEIDLDFYGPEVSVETPFHVEVETWIIREAGYRLNQISAKTFGRVRRTFASFPKSEFRANLKSQFGISGVFVVLYYLAIALFWWRRLQVAA